MKLQYRGISYEVTSYVQSQPQERVESKYRGITTSIPLPKVGSSLDDAFSLMMYRGIRLATY